MSLFCDGVLEDGSPCNGTFDLFDKFCRFCGKRKDKVQNVVETKNYIDPNSETNGNGEEPELTKDVSTEASDEQNSLSRHDRDSDEITADQGACNRSDSVQEEIGSLPSGPGRSENELLELEQVAQRGLQHLKEYIERKNNEWKSIQLHVGVTGLSGVGKSSFINAIRGLKPGHPNYAKVDINETTTEIKPYPHHENRNLIFWDMPGAGTKSFPRQGYFKMVQFDKFDFFLILFHKRFHEDVTWLAQQVKSLGKQCFFVRTHTHADVENDKLQNLNQSIEDTLDRIRENSIKNLEENGMNTDEVFLIDNNKTYLYDFDKLTGRLIYEIPNEVKREAFVLALSSVSESVINEKKKALAKRIKRIALLSAFVGAVPVPMIGATVDTFLIVTEADEYRRQFGLTEEALKERFSDLQIIEEFCEHYLKLSTAAFLTIAADEAAENSMKFGIPVLGSIVSGALSYGVTIATLKKILNSLTEDAHKVNRMVMGLLRQ